MIDQGAEIARPSRLHARVFGNAERPLRIEVGGGAVVIGRGEIQLDAQIGGPWIPQTGGEV